MPDPPPVRTGQRVTEELRRDWVAPFRPAIDAAARVWVTSPLPSGRQPGRQADDGERGPEWARAHGPDATTKREAAAVECPRCRELVPPGTEPVHAAERHPEPGPPLAAWQVRRALAEAPYVGGEG